MFVQLRNSLNLIWGVAPQSEQGVWSTIRSQLIAFGMVAMCALLLLGTLLLSAVLTTMGSWITDTLHVGELPLHFANFVFSFVLVATLVALIFKFVSAANISWADAWRGALLFSLLFVIGKVLIGLYLGRSGVSSAFGAAGSVILLMLWVYYSSQMLFFGAEFAGVYAELRGRRIEPQPIHIPKHAT
jgi:membrane protein